ncbi:MAG: methionyl-tRNA formyltransferase [Chitinophagales bacterium]
MMEKLRIIFMGTPDFAVATLQAMVEEGFNVVAVITSPDKPAGRGLQLQQSAVKKYARSVSLPVLQPERLRDPEFIETLKSYHADLQVVVAFRMLPEVVWSMPRLGTINLHASLLPDYRGAAPINHVIIHGEKKTGVTTFFLKHAIDTGDMIFRAEVEIAADETAGTLHDKLMEAGAVLMIKTLHAVESGDYTTTPQSGSSEKTAPKLFRNDCLIHWNNTADTILHFIRGLSPYPCAFTLHNNSSIKIFAAHAEITPHTETTGNISSDNKTYIRWAVKDGYVYGDEIQVEGKKRMPTTEYLRGNSI